MALAVAHSSRAAALPQWIPPQLTQLVAAAPEGDQWLHEIKFDGYRMHARLDRGAVRLLTRTGFDWTHKYSAIVRHRRSDLIRSIGEEGSSSNMGMRSSPILRMRSDRRCRTQECGSPVTI